MIVKEPFFDLEEKQAFITIIKGFFFPFSFLLILGFFSRLIGVNSKPYLKLLFSIVMILPLSYIVRFFYNEYQLTKTNRFASEKTNDRVLTAFVVKPKSNPLIIKYKILFPLICLTVIVTLVNIFIFEAKIFFLLGIIFLFVTFSLIMFFSETMVINIHEESLQIISKRPLSKSSWLLDWKYIIKYFKKVEYREKDKGVVIYTVIPSLFHEDKFTPFRALVIGYYANIFIPVNNASEAEFIKSFVKEKLVKMENAKNNKYKAF